MFNAIEIAAQLLKEFAGNIQDMDRQIMTDYSEHEQSLIWLAVDVLEIN